MNAGEFEARLRAAGYGEIVEAGMAAGTHRDTHSHDYDVEALVLEGAITLTCAGAARRYEAGESFALAAGLPHEEDVGPAGVRYLVGRRKV